ncbi:MAG TPA: hypothetical protein VNM43_11410 [Dehalococcoidia bacterium]|nr:hypothetical protein [Dehalococcoidia bacterium]
MSDFARVAYRRALTRNDPGMIQVSFDQRVLDRYRGVPGFSVVRTDTIGRVRREGGWSLDFGIAPGEEQIHVCLGDLFEKLPESEREHWAAHVVTLPLSDRYVQARLQPGSCVDDGDLRTW